MSEGREGVCSETRFLGGKNKDMAKYKTFYLVHIAGGTEPDVLPGCCISYSDWWIHVCIVHAR